MTKPTRVALVLFVDVLDDDGSHPTEASDAWVIARRALNQAVGQFDGRTHTVEMSKHTLRVRFHEAMEVGMAAGNGYLWTEPTSKAFRQYEWQEFAGPTGEQP